MSISETNIQNSFFHPPLKFPQAEDGIIDLRKIETDIIVKINFMGKAEGQTIYIPAIWYAKLYPKVDMEFGFFMVSKSADEQEFIINPRNFDRFSETGVVVIYYYLKDEEKLSQPTIIGVIKA